MAFENVRVDGFDNSSDVFEQVQQTLAENGVELTKKVGGVILVKVTRKDGVQASWIIDAKNNGGSVRIAKADEDKADTTISISDDDLMKLFNGKLNIAKALLFRRIKVGGDMNLARKLQNLANTPMPLQAKL